MMTKKEVNVKSKRTEWFPKHILPVHKGWYECKNCPTNNKFAKHYWDGNWWRWGVSGILLYPDANIIWRGLARKV